MRIAYFNATLRAGQDGVAGSIVRLVAAQRLTRRSGWSAVGCLDPTEAMPCGLPAWS